MAIEAPRRPEESIHGEPEVKPRFGPRSDEATPAGNPTDPRGHGAAAGNPSDPRGDKVASRDSLRQAEGSPSTETSRPASQETSALGGKLGKGYRGGDKGTLRQRIGGRFRAINLRSRRSITTMAIAGVLGGGGILGFSYLQGPFQIIQLAQSLQKSHFLTNENQGDDRFTRLTRYIYHGGDSTQLRLGYFANKYADRIENKYLKSIGVETQYQGKYNYKQRYQIDPEKLANTDLADFRDKSPEQLKRHLEKKYPRMNVSIEDGKLIIPFKDLGYFQNSRFLKDTLRASGFSKVQSPVAQRILKARYAISFSPIKKADRKVKEKVADGYKRWKESWNSKMTENLSFSRAPTIAGDDEEEKPTRESIRGKLAIGGGVSVAGVGVLCLLKDINETAESDQVAKIILMSRIASDYISLGSQVMSGKNIDMQQLGYYVKQLHGEDSRGKKSSWNEAESGKAELGEQGGVKPNKAIRSATGGAPFAFVNSQPLAGFLSGACGTVASIALALAGFIAAPVSAAISTAASIAAGPLVIDTIVDFLINEGPTSIVDAVGADMGNVLNFGARTTADFKAISGGGRQLSKGEEAGIASYEAVMNKEEFQSKSFAQRMFDLRDYRSLASVFMGSGVKSVWTGIADVFTSPLKLVDNFFLAKTASAEKRLPYDYGVAKYGFSVEEMNNDELENPYINAEKVMQLLPAYDCPESAPCPPTDNTLANKVHDCFGVFIEKDSRDITDFNAAQPTLDDVKGDCNDSLKSDGSPSDMLRVRMYILDTQTMAANACYQGDSEACTLLGIESAAPSPDTVSGGSVSGSAQELAQELVDSDKVTGDSRYMSQIEAVANGNDDCHINTTILKVLVGGLRAGHSFNISSLNRFCTGVLTASGTASYHYASGGGHAVDLSIIDGAASTGRSPEDVAFLEDVFEYMPSGSGIGQIGCPSQSIDLPSGVTEFEDSCNHVHIQVPQD